ncbi:hypothetical protein GQ457_02G024330 [Hibiscus cannabinus]
MNAARGSNVAGGLHAASGPNDCSGPNTTSGTNERVDEVFYEELNDVDGDSSESDWVDGDNLLSDDDDDEEMVAIKNKSKLVEDLGPDVVLEESVHVSIEENEDLKGLGGGEETDYLDSSDAGSYETDSDGGIICKKSGKIVEIENLGREELKVELQKHTCIKARKWALEKIRGSVVLEFNKLFDYVFALRSVDPNGTFELMVERSTEVEKPKFRRLYVCFSALKEGFKRFCRPIISLDGCYLKGSFKGEILSVVGRDGNNQIFPIAWALVEVENRDTWTWFLQNIQKDLNLGDGSNFTLISDMQKGLLEEVHQCLPNVEHRFCARHMYANWKKLHKGGDLQLMFWSCCKATTRPQFEQYSLRIGQLKKKAFDDLILKDPQHWSKAFFSTRSKCDTIDNNFSEAFNFSILGARFKSVISMFEEIRHYVMLRLVEHKTKSLSWKGELSLDAELWGVYSGVRCALDSGFHKVIFESDCLDMIRLLLLGSAHNNRMPVLSNIRDLLWYLDDFQFTHVQREGTKVMDRLCDFVSSLDFEIHVLEALMDALARLLLADVG